MTGHVKMSEGWGEITQIPVKDDEGFVGIESGWFKADTGWVRIWSGGALIEFLGYPYPIPVASGWQYSTDGKTWTNVEADGDINTSGTFTGYVKAKGELSLNGYASVEEEIRTTLRKNGSSLSVSRYTPTSFVNGGKGYVCGGYQDGGPSKVVDVYSSSGTRTTGTELSYHSAYLTSFANGSKGYVCGGYTSTSYDQDTEESYFYYYLGMDVYDSSGTKTTGTSLSSSRHNLTSFVNNSKGYVCGGYNNNGTSSVVDVYNSSGTRTTGNSLSVARSSPTSFVNNSKGYVCGGSASDPSSVVDVYSSSGTRTTGTSLSTGRWGLTSFVNGSKGYVCGGYNGGTKSTVDVYDSSGNRTTGTPLSVARYYLTSFTNDGQSYVCGGYSGSVVSVVDIYDSSGNRTTGIPLNSARDLSTSFVNNSMGYVCGGYNAGTEYSTVDVYYDTYDTIYSTNIPITEGSTYTLNGESGTAEVSEVLTFDTKVTGTIKYKKGSIPSS